jgi:hypothetical protein
MSYKLSNRPIPLSFPVTSFTMNTLNGDTSRLYLLTRYARERVARQLPGELQLLEISPDSLIFRFATEVRRKIPVQPVINFKPGRNFTLKDGVRISPDSVWVTGPDIYVDTFPQEVRVTGRIGLSKYERIVPEAFWVGVDYKETLENKSRLQVQLRTTPEALNGVSFYPQTVEYLLSVK